MHRSSWSVVLLALTVSLALCVVTAQATSNAGSLDNAHIIYRGTEKVADAENTDRYVPYYHSHSLLSYQQSLVAVGAKSLF